MAADAFASYIWEPYPRDIPESRRLPCSVCGRPAEVIRYRHEQFGSFGGGSLDLNGPPPPEVRSLVTAFCLEHAEQNGYGTYKERGELPPHLNHIQRWIAHALDLGDPEHLA
jgi:hypothetical protein